MAAADPQTLEDACRAGRVEIVRRILADQPSLISHRSSHGETLLHLACIGASPMLVEYLLTHRAFGVSRPYVNAPNFRGTAALYYVGISSEPEPSLEIAQTLLRFGADPREISGFSGQTPAGAARTRARASKNPAAENLADVLVRAEERLERVRNDSRGNFRYRLGKWGGATAHFLALPERLRQAQFSTNYRLEPGTKAAFDKDGEAAAFAFCARRDREFLGRIYEGGGAAAGADTESAPWAPTADQCLACGNNADVLVSCTTCRVDLCNSCSATLQTFHSLHCGKKV